MRLFPLNQGVLAALLLAGPGCEGCDFSFGQVQLSVQVEPEDVDATVTLCTEDEGCQVRWVGTAVDTGFDTGLGSGVFRVGHEGYLVCQVPAYTLTVESPDCQTVTIEERARAVGNAETLVRVSLDCG